jgi:SAM-dependent methyltransferase
VPHEIHEPAAPTDSFLTRHGVRIPLEPNHRREVKPSGSGYDQPSGDGLVDYLMRVDERVRLGTHLLELCGGEVRGTRVLLVGAEDGAEVVSLLGRGAASVTATNFGAAFVSDHADARTGWAAMQAAAIAAAPRLGWRADAPGSIADRVVFRTDDLCASTLPDASFDLLMSWQTLEHIADPAAAMRETHRLLRPGGLAYHEYNPFFAIDGGHTPVTLDFPWGHARLDSEDIERFLRRHRPAEADHAMAFLRTALNGASHREIRAAIDASGLETAAWIPRFRPEDALRVTPEILRDVQAVHPSADLLDLTCRIVRCVLRRPAVA